MMDAAPESPGSLMWGAIAAGVKRSSAKRGKERATAAGARGPGSLHESSSLPSLGRRDSLHQEIGLFAFGALGPSGTIRRPGSSASASGLGRVNEGAYYAGPVEKSPLLRSLEGIGTLHDVAPLLSPAAGDGRSAPPFLSRKASTGRAGGAGGLDRGSRDSASRDSDSRDRTPRERVAGSSRQLDRPGSSRRGMGSARNSRAPSTSGRHLERLAGTRSTRSARTLRGSDESIEAQNIFESDSEQLAVLRRAQILSRRAMELRTRSGERQQRCRDKRADQAKMERLRLLAVLEERRTRSARIEAVAQNNLRRTLWLALVAGGGFVAAQRRSLQKLRRTRNVARWQHAAATILQNMFRARTARAMWHRFALYARLMKRQRIRMCLAVRCFKRWHAMNVVNNFLLMYAHDASKLQILVMRFTTRVYYCQELSRRWLAIQRARVACLTLAWHAAEAQAMADEQRDVNDRVAAARAEMQAKLDRMGRVGRGAAPEDDEPPPVPLSPRAAREKRRKKRKEKRDASHTHARILAESEQFMNKCKFKDALLQELLAQHRAKYDEACEDRKPINVLRDLVEHALRRSRLEPGHRPATAPADLGGDDGDSCSTISTQQMRKQTSRGAFMLGHSANSARTTLYGSSPSNMKAPEYLPRVASVTRVHLLTALLLRRKRAFFRHSRGGASKKQQLQTAFEEASSSSEEGDEEEEEEVFAVSHTGGFSAGDARKWLKIDKTEVGKAPGSPTPGPPADSSTMLMSHTQNRYQFFASFGGAGGMRAAVKATMLAERARMAAIQEAICGPLEIHL